MFTFTTPARTLSTYFAILDFGRNALKTYGKKEDKPLWWPKLPKRKKFRCHLKDSKDECTKLIQHLLEHFGVDVSKHYIGYPERTALPTPVMTKLKGSVEEGTQWLIKMMMMKKTSQI